MRRLIVEIIVSITVLAMVFGCSGKSKTPPPDQQAEPSEAPAPAAAPAQADMVMSKTTEIETSKTIEATAGAAMGYSYDPLNKPDPFKPFLLKDDITAKGVEINPLLKYEIRYFKLTGILRAGGAPKAVFEDPSGKAFVVSVGDRIGRSGGVIRSINKDEVVITETRLSWAREGTETVEFTIKLRRELEAAAK